MTITIALILVDSFNPTQNLQCRRNIGQCCDRWQPETPNEQRLRGDTLKAIGDLLQFLKQSSDALSRYDAALEIYCDVGDRLGGANVLCELGRLQTDPNQAMASFLAAQAIYEQIDDQYSQGRNLLMFIVPAQIQAGDSAGALQSLDQATAIGQAIDFEPFCEYADQLRAQVQADHS